MKKFLAIMMVVCALFSFVASQAQAAYNFGDFTSSTLTTKAWGALKDTDIEGVLAYTNKCIELYGAEAEKMQAGLSDYPKGTNEEIFAYWALNDVATCLFIQGEVYRRANMEEEAQEVYEKILNDYSYGQAWDVNGWFWKPAGAAKEKLAMLKTGLVLDFGDYTSSFIVGQAWKSLEDENIEKTLMYTDKVLELYATKAAEMQESLTEYPWQSREQIFNYWALNDVGTALFVKAKALTIDGKTDEAKEAYESIVNDYTYAQCWDPQGWFWKPADAAQEALDAM